MEQTLVEKSAKNLVKALGDEEKIASYASIAETEEDAQAVVAALNEAISLGIVKETEESGTWEVTNEAIVKKVDKKGKITRVLDRKTRSRRATQTTGISKTKRKLIARKAARTKKRDVGGKRRALKQRKRTLRKRKALGL